MIHEKLIEEDGDYEADKILVTIDDDCDGEGSVHVTIRQGGDVISLAGSAGNRLVEILFPHCI